MAAAPISGFKNISEVHEHDMFMNRLTFPMMRGRVGKEYRIQFDAGMCRKTLMLCHALECYEGKVFWIDSDMIVHATPPDDFLSKILPDDKLSCFLGREYMYTESGFLGINAGHPICKQFIKLLRQTLFSGAVFHLKGWHDCFVYDFVRGHLPQKHFVNLSEDIPKHRGVHPFVNSVLGKYFDHLKGNRKLSGKSSPNDFIEPRSEAYWTNV